MKKVLVFLLLGLSCIGMVGCGDISINASDKGSDTNVTAEKIEDTYGYDIVEAFQLAIDIGELEQQTKDCIEDYQSEAIGTEEFIEDINELADRYGGLDIDFLEETDYYYDISNGIRDTKDAMYAMSDAISREDGKTLIQATSKLKAGQKLITETLNRMDEDSK